MRPQEARSFIKQRLVALSITGALLLAIGALITLVIAGPQVQRLVVPEQLQGQREHRVRGAAGAARAVVLVLLFAFVYWIGPNRELPEWKWMSPGALVGVVGWIVASLGFTLYVQNFGNYDNGTYAGLGGVIVLMLWLQISMLILLVGAEFNARSSAFGHSTRLCAQEPGWGISPSPPGSTPGRIIRMRAAVISLPEAADRHAPVRHRSAPARACIVGGRASRPRRWRG
jgi:membrane protein